LTIVCRVIIIIVRAARLVIGFRERDDADVLLIDRRTTPHPVWVFFVLYSKQTTIYIYFVLVLDRSGYRERSTRYRFIPFQWHRNRTATKRRQSRTTNIIETTCLWTMIRVVTTRSIRQTTKSDRTLCCIQYSRYVPCLFFSWVR